MPSTADFATAWHGQDGLLPIRRYAPENLTPIQAAFVEACRVEGYRYVADHNAPGATGIGPAPMNRLGTVRQSTALAYLALARRRPNLAIRSQVLVDRVLFDGARAIGVRLAAPNETVYAGRVILAAGTYSSPAILIRSGIGPAGHVAALGMPVVQDLPGVGENLVDHPLARHRSM